MEDSKLEGTEQIKFGIKRSAMKYISKILDVIGFYGHILTGAR